MPRRLKIAYTERAFEIFGTVNGRDSIKAAQTDFTDTSALIIEFRERIFTKDKYRSEHKNSPSICIEELLRTKFI